MHPHLPRGAVCFFINPKQLLLLCQQYHHAERITTAQSKLRQSHFNLNCHYCLISVVSFLGK